MQTQQNISWIRYYLFFFLLPFSSILLIILIEQHFVTKSTTADVRFVSVSFFFRPVLKSNTNDKLNIGEKNHCLFDS